MRYFSLLITAFLLFSCDNSAESTQSLETKDRYVVSLSVSSDGKHVISALANKHIILWDINTKQKQLLSSNGNIFSAYFIRHSDRYLWQDLNNIVHIQNISGEILKTFEHFPTYGHVMSSDLKHYLSSDAGWGLYSGHNSSLINFKAPDEGSFTGHGKLLNLELIDKTGTFLSSGYVYDWKNPGTTNKQRQYAKKLSYEGVVIWDINANKLKARLSGNSAKTFATLSPDGRYVVSGGENTNGFVWDIKKNKRKHWLASLYHGRIINREEHWEKWNRDKTGLIVPPKDMGRTNTLAIKFVSPNHYIMLFYDNRYAALYHIDNDMPIKYFDLGDDPFPSVKEYYRNVSIDTAPEAGILVTGQHRGSGINVYQFDKEKLTLEKIWVTN